MPYTLYEVGKSWDLFSCKNVHTRTSPVATEHGKRQLSENSSETSHQWYAQGISASSDEISQKSLSRKHLQEINRKVVVSVGDGNSLFHSISNELLGTESYYALARLAVTDTIVNNPKIFSQLCNPWWITSATVSTYESTRNMGIYSRVDSYTNCISGSSPCVLSTTHSC